MVNEYIDWGVLPCAAHTSSERLIPCNRVQHQKCVSVRDDDNCVDGVRLRRSAITAFGYGAVVKVCVAVENEKKKYEMDWQTVALGHSATSPFYLSTLVQTHFCNLRNRA